jgi:ribosomal protein S8
MNTTNYLIGNLVTQINLGAKRRLRFIMVNLNDTSLEILNILYKHGAIRTFIVKNNKILIYYKYYLNRIAVKMSIISKPGNRIYFKLNKLSYFYNNHNFSGFYIISTQKGLFTSNYCLLDGRISGEVLLKVEI